MILTSTIAVVVLLCFCLESTLGATSLMQVTATLTTSQLANSRQVPQSYIGLSHEPLSQASYYVNASAYVKLVNNLLAYNTGPISVRWGGNSQDDDTQIYSDDVWAALKSMFFATSGRVTHHIPVNLAARNVSAAVAQITAASKIVPRQAVNVINIGNEPDSYMYKRNRDSGTGNFTLKPPYMTDPHSDPNYLRDQLAFMNALAPIVKSWLNTTKVFSGPALSNTKDFGTGMVDTFTSLGNKQYVKMYTLHYYTVNSKKTYANMDAMLRESEMDYIRDVVSRHVAKTKPAGVIFRMDETNSMSSSGKFNVSDTLGAALFMIDYAFTVMQVGCDGMNFHDSGCSPYSPILFPGWCGNSSGGYQTDSKFLSMCPSTCGQPNAPALVNAPYFGMWFVQRALQDAASLMLYGASALRLATASGIKGYVLRNATEYRIVLVNKAASTNTSVAFTLTGSAATPLGSAQVLRLTGSSGLTSKYPNITFAGQNIEAATGRITGQLSAQTVTATAVVSGYTYTISMPPGSAALVTVPITASPKLKRSKLMML